MEKNVQEILTDCTLCYHSCGCVVTIEDGKAVSVRGLESHPLNKGKLCPKGEIALDNIYDPKRFALQIARISVWGDRPGGGRPQRVQPALRVPR